MARASRWILVALVGSIAPGCATDCARKAERRLECPDGYQPYGRRKPNQNKGWMPIFALDLDAWAAAGTLGASRRCEVGCVPATLGPAEALAACDQVNPCGGDPTGDWRYEPQACPYEVPVSVEGACSRATQARAATPDGTLTIDEDGTIRFNGTQIAFADTVAIPPDCLDTTDACTDLLIGDGCAGDPSQGCACAQEGTEVAMAWEGTWQAKGTRLYVTIAGEERVVDYCVEGDTLSLVWDEDADGVRVRSRLFRFVN